MSWVLLVFGAWCALHALNAWRPVRRNRVLFIWSFFAAWITIEAAPIWLVVELVVGALLVWAGALDQRRRAGSASVLLVARVDRPGGAGRAGSGDHAIGRPGLRRLRPRRARGPGQGRPRARSWSSATSSSDGWPASVLAPRRLPPGVRRASAVRPSCRSTAAPGSSATSASRASRCCAISPSHGWVGLQRELPAEPRGHVPRPPGRSSRRRWRGSAATPTSTASTPTSWSSPGARPAGT